ncbi:high mobility group B protein 1-like isoform X1 [Salvia splendens]|uniref:high mobility group B protein 1-like isoform X1 n=2 Tax=Salvia splendens TaxID=180675 RepID=UPI001C278790|nr:high mobility group B protein 1-like isoform X1 [Salvia splendens]
MLSHLLLLGTLVLYSSSFFITLLSIDPSQIASYLLDMKTGSRSRGATRKETKDALKPVDDRRAGKRKGVQKEDTRKSKKEKTAIKDPNKPKRPPSAFFVFLEDFRKTFKKENPNVKAVSAVGKAGGERWKSLSEAEKAPYEAKAAKRKAEYEKLMTAYLKKQESSSDEDDEGSEKSASEVHDDEQEEDEDEGDNDDE